MSPMSHDDQRVALSNVPRTTREALERIVEYGRTRRFIQSQMRNGSRRCPIGLFFSDAQIDDLDKEPGEGGPASMAPVVYLSDIIGYENFRAITGMEPREAAAIQFGNDEHGHSYIIRAIKAVLAGKTTEIEFCRTFDDIDSPNPYYQPL